MSAFVFPEQKFVNDWLEYLVENITTAVLNKRRPAPVMGIEELKKSGGWASVVHNNLRATIKTKMPVGDAWLICDALDQRAKDLYNKRVFYKSYEYDNMTQDAEDCVVFISSYFDWAQ